jgi:hypothetical protein
MDIQMAMLFTIVAGLPDNHCGNMAVQEVSIDDDDDKWGLRIVHFDTGLFSPQAGVSLESLKLDYDPAIDGVDRNGGEDYFYPILFSSVFAEAANAPLDPKIREFLLHKDQDFERVVSDCGDRFPSGIGKIFQSRWSQMQRYAEAHPECTCQELAFDTIAAWKRDYAFNEEREDFVDWLLDVKYWANNGGQTQIIMISTETEDIY